MTFMFDFVLAWWYVLPHSVIVYKTQKQFSWRPLHLQLVSMWLFPSPSVWLFPSAAISFVYSATLFIHLGKLYICLVVTDATDAKSTIHTQMWGFAQRVMPLHKDATSAKSTIRTWMWGSMQRVMPLHKDATYVNSTVHTLMWGAMQRVMPLHNGHWYWLITQTDGVCVGSVPWMKKIRGKGMM